MIDSTSFPINPKNPLVASKEVHQMMEEIRRRVDRRSQEEGCKHLSLCFQDGGYYVICSYCRCKWVAVKDSDSNLDESRRNCGLTDFDFRDRVRL